MSNLHHTVYSGMTLKELLQNPDLQRAPVVVGGAPSQKVKKIEDEAGSSDFTSAFLGPQLWNKTYNSNDFNLEYMDLDEFLGENLNEVPAVETVSWDDLLTTSPQRQHSPLPEKVQSPFSSPKPQGSPGPFLHVNTSPHTSPSPHIGFGGLQVSPPHKPHTVPLTAPSSSAHSLVIPPVRTSSSSSMMVRAKGEAAEDAVQTTANARCTSPGAVSSGSTPPVSPVTVQVDFRLNEQDLALSSIPGQSAFDPTCHTFTEEELKPQPMVKKSRKIFVPEDLKDDRYWARRKKNNVAAKRSRDARRVKENQIAMRASYLEKENMSIRDEIEKMRHENAHLKRRLSKYEPTA
ncbi:thyrotroph embryonic factor-like [Babylonia areolata]|uniref:thyrotroph embryonic factor-like n=1 Tax=Babylonia areolata TaxID=304850 RepID=UPI003FD3F5D9